jgi:Kazal-type serine protease inhibitor domain
LYDDFSFGTVCASNGRSYTRTREIRCLKESNPALEVLHDGACTVQEVEKIIGLDDVCKMAMHTFESNPLCGSDNVTYSNAYTFLCAAKSSPKDKSTKLKAQFFISNAVIQQTSCIFFILVSSYCYYFVCLQGKQKIAY